MIRNLRSRIFKKKDDKNEKEKTPRKKIRDRVKDLVDVVIKKFRK